MTTRISDRRHHDTNWVQIADMDRTTLLVPVVVRSEKNAAQSMLGTRLPLKTSHLMMDEADKGSSVQMISRRMEEGFTMNKKQGG